MAFEQLKMDQTFLAHTTMQEIAQKVILKVLFGIRQEEQTERLRKCVKNLSDILATIFVVLITIISMAVMPVAEACSRLVYQGNLLDGAITARSMDWLNQPDAKLWVFPKGMRRDGGAGQNSITWTSKYGSIITSSYDIATVDGINDKGLVANLLFLVDTDYGEIGPHDKTLSIGGWGQYVLDNYATVGDDVEFESKTRWKIEDINREIKQLTGLGFCQCRLRIIQKNHIACAMLVWNLLKKIATKIGKSIYQFKHELLSKYLYPLSKLG
jgi:hypothetical protein